MRAILDGDGFEYDKNYVMLCTLNLLSIFCETYAFEESVTSGECVFCT